MVIFIANEIFNAKQWQYYIVNYFYISCFTTMYLNTLLTSKRRKCV